MSRKITQEEFKERLKQVHGDSVSLLGKFDGMRQRTLFRCKCGRPWRALPFNVLNSSGCTKCTPLHTPKYNTESFTKALEKACPGKFIVLGKYISCDELITLKCKKCGYEWSPAPRQILKSKQCPKCSHQIQKTTEDFAADLEAEYPGRYEVIGEYKNNKTKILVKCKKCGHSWPANPKALLAYGGCRHCNESKGELAIGKILKDNKIIFGQQYKFNDCRDKLPLPFDFAIYSRNEELLALVEYDGEQHSKPIRGKKSLCLTQYHDSIKTEYCRTHNIPLLRIPYWDFDKIKDLVLDFCKETGALN